MFDILKARLKQKYRTLSYPKGPPPPLPARFAGRPVIGGRPCDTRCRRCADACPVGALQREEGQFPTLDTGKCLFCRECPGVCPTGAISFTREFRLAASSRERLTVTADSQGIPPVRHEIAATIFRRSLKLRQVSAGGCNACEADTNVLTTLAWDIGRFGIQFVASPRHADGLLITGPVTRNMQLALKKTYDAIPAPKLVIAVGACAVSGGPYAGHPKQLNGAALTVPVDLYIPGCPPHPLTILDGLLRLIGRQG